MALAKLAVRIEQVIQGLPTAVTGAAVLRGPSARSPRRHPWREWDLRPSPPRGQIARVSSMESIDLRQPGGIEGIRTALEAVASDLRGLWYAALERGDFDEITRLVEASHAVHRATLALRADNVISGPDPSIASWALAGDLSRK
jgi:hypothetical protein